jgi:hypothetical protein
MEICQGYEKLPSFASFDPKGKKKGKSDNTDTSSWPTADIYKSESSNGKRSQDTAQLA